MDILQRLKKLPGRVMSIPGGFKRGVNQFFHDAMFEPGGALYPVCKKIARSVDTSSSRGSFASLEYIVKGLFYDCRHCGDCTLGDNAFICPQSQCAKFLLNGPCGGSRDGWCEVWPGKKRCIYVRVYERIRETGMVRTLSGKLVPPRDWSLNETSSWLNFYLGRDHSGKE
jgi:methylenetetrahydrofolate reductase (NADPH)